MPVAATGCGYQFGTGFDRRIRTVHVPTFTSDSFRRDFGERLTEAVQREIGMRTPYRLVTAAGGADTRLIGHIAEVRKDIITETRYDDVREAQLLIALTIRWEDVRTGQVISEQVVPIGPPGTDLVALASFAPELGQSRATAEQQVLDDLARQVVGLMESPW